MHKTNQTKNFKRQPGDLHRWRPASLFSFAVLIILVYLCRRLIRVCLHLCLLLRILLMFIVLLNIIPILILRLLLLLIFIIRLLLLLLLLLLLFLLLPNYSNESVGKLRE